MATVRPQVGDDAFLRLVSDALAEEVTAYLKGPLMALAEEQINAAVTRAVEAMKPRLEAYVSEYDMRATINVILAAKAADAN